MFTGIVQALGTVRAFDECRLIIDVPDMEGEPWQIGESIAVNGCCLTLVSFERGLAFDVTEETLGRTTMRSLASGTRVNVERAMKASDRMGGHIVQGHVDGVGELRSVEAFGQSRVMRFRVPSEYARYLIDKGSIAVDGISLTVVQPEGDSFEVAVIPHTWQQTNLSQLAAGDRVNLEFDVLAKYAEKQR